MRSAARGVQIPGPAVRAPPRPAVPPPAFALRPAVRLRRRGGRDFRAGRGPQGAPPSRGADWAGRPGTPEGGGGGSSSASGRDAAATSAGAVRPPPPRAMAGSSSLEAVRRKIRSLQEQADSAEERAGSLQRELDCERKLRETVRDPLPTPYSEASAWSSPSPGGPFRAHLPEPPLRPEGTPGAPGPAGAGLWGGALPFLLASSLV